MPRVVSEPYNFIRKNLGKIDLIMNRLYSYWKCNFTEKMVTFFFFITSAFSSKLTFLWSRILVQYSVIIEHGNMQDLLKNICKYTRNKKEDKVKFVHTGRAKQSVKKKPNAFEKFTRDIFFWLRLNSCLPHRFLNVLRK